MEVIPIRFANENPLMYSTQYEIEFLDRTTEITTANIIVENILAQVEQEGHW